jgi:hypothetical protein
VFAISAVGFSAGKKKPPSVYEMLQRSKYARRTPKVFLKKCIKCQIEIPLASEECPYCMARQTEIGTLNS